MFEISVKSKLSQNHSSPLLLAAWKALGNDYQKFEEMPLLTK